MPSRKNKKGAGRGGSGHNSSSALPLHVDTSGAAGSAAPAPTERTALLPPPSMPALHATRLHPLPLPPQHDEIVFDDDDHITDDGSIAQLKEHIGTSMVGPPGGGAAAAGGGGAVGGLASQLRPLFHIPYLPFLAYGRRYFEEDVWADVVAGIVVSIVAIPQGLAYSLLASLPAETGLYTSLVPPMVYGLLGTSRQLSAGPVALVSMFIPTIAIQMRMQRDPALRLSVACMASIVSGCLLMMMGAFKLGGLVRFISSPVLTGFTTASALVIGISQSQHVLGVALPQFTYTQQTVAYLWRHSGEANTISLVIGTATIVFLIAARNLAKRNPHLRWLRALNTVSTLLVLVASTLASYLLTQAGYTFPIVGHVPAGSPHFSASLPLQAVRDLAGLGDLIVACLPVTLLAFMSSWSLARKYASKFGQMDLDANQEAFAIGAANAVAGFFSCFPSSGSFSRTTLNALNGARTPLSNISASVAVLACLWFFTPLLYYVPMSCLGGIIEASLVSLFEYKPFKKAWRISRPDFVVMCVTAGTTAIVNIEVGLCVGIFVSIAVLLQELSELHTSVMVPVPSAGGRYLVRSQSVDPSVLASECDFVKVMRLTASLFFANQEELRNAFQALVLSGGVDIKAVVVDASGVSHLDLTGVEAIDFMWKFASEKGIKLVFANAKGIFRERLKSSKLWAKIGAEAYENLSVDEVVNKLLQEQGIGGTSMQDLHWGSPKMGAAGAGQNNGAGGPRSVALRRGVSGKGRDHRSGFDTVAEGDEEEGGGDENVGLAFSSSLSPPVFAAGMEGVSVHVEGGNGNGHGV